MICVSLGETSVTDTLRSLDKLHFAEIRMDMIKDLDLFGLRKIFSKETQLIATFRKGSDTQKNRNNFLIEAIRSGAAYVDVDIDSDDVFIKKIINESKKHNTKTIFSYHNFEITPSYDKLIKIYIKIKNAGADIAKIACKVNEPSDNIKLIRLMKEKNIISIGIGQEGRITRVAGLFLKSPFTFASISKEKETAEGQFEINSLEKILKEIDK